MDERLLSRRNALKSIATGGVTFSLAGCLGDPSNSDQATSSPTDSSPTPTQTVTPIPTSTRTATATPVPKPTPPEPDIVVASDGSGDYDSFDLAHEAAEEGWSQSWGDVIKLKSGTYEGSLTKKALIIVGSGAENTTLNLTRGKLPFDVQLWNMTVQAPGTDVMNTHYNGNVRTYYVNTEFGFDIGRGGNLACYDSTINGPVSTEILRGEKATFQDVTVDVYERKTKPAILTDSRVTGNLLIKNSSGYSDSKLTDTTVDGYTLFGTSNGKFTVDGCTLGGLKLTSGRDVTVQDTEIHANEDIGTALRVAGSNTTAKNCVITTAQGQPDTAIKASGGWAVLNSEIVGKATGGGGTVKWNTFKNPGGLTWFIDGKFGHDVIGNAFIGADIRIDSNDVSVYNIDKKLGNYYSAFSKPDSNDDGIIDTARELPGDAGLVDEFPLASKDLSQYQE